MKLGFGLYVVLFIQVLSLSAAAAGPGVTYQGRILKPDGSPLEGASVQFRMQVRSPGSENCLLFDEMQTISMVGSAGAFALTLNDGSGTRLDTPTYPVTRIFANRDSMTLDASRCSMGTTYTPSSADGRKFIVYFKDETMSAFEPLPILNLNYIPQSLYALEAEKVGTFAADSILRAVDVGGNPVTAPALNPTQLSTLTTLLAGSGGPSASSIGGAVGTNAIDNANFAQTWNWSTATTQNPMTMTANALTTGTLLNLTSSNATLNSTNGLLNVANTSASTTGTVARIQSNSTAGSGLTVLANGNVGIGTTAPNAPLRINYADTSNDLEGLRIQNTANSATNGMAIYNSAGSRTISFGNNNTANEAYIWNYSNTPIKIGTNNAERIRIDAAGNVGIGTTTPSSKLEVATSLTAASGTDYGVKILPTVNASGTAGYTGLLLNVAQTATGSGTKRLMDLQVGGFSLFSIGNTGTATMTSTSSAADFLVFNNHQGTSKAINFSGGQIPNAGSLLYYRPTSDPQSGIMGNLIDIQPIRFASSARTDTDTGNYLRIARANTVQNAVGSLTVTGHLASLSSNCTQTSGTCTDSSSILSLTQSYPNATGAVLTVTNSGTGSAATFMGGTVGIGTTSPSTILQVVSTDSTINQSLNNTAAIDIWNKAGSLYTGGQINFRSDLNSGPNGIGAVIGYTNMASTVGGGSSGNLSFGVKPDRGDTSVIQAMTIQSDGKVGIGLTGPSFLLDVNGDVNIAAANVLRFGGTQVCASAGCTAVSDRRLKEDIQPLQNSLDNILKLQGVSYYWIDKEKYGQSQQIGLIAQDLEKVFPQAVVTDQSSGLKSVAYDHLVAPLIEAFRSLNLRFNEIHTLLNKVSTEQSREIASMKDEANAWAAKLKANDAAKDKKIKELEERLEKIEKALNSK